VRIHRNKNRPIERDREGRRRYSAPDAASVAIAPPAAPPDAASADPARRPTPAANSAERKP
jgi:hypothetical protein